MGSRDGQLFDGQILQYEDTVTIRSSNYLVKSFYCIEIESC